jgi:hypothetical protein
MMKRAILSTLALLLMCSAASASSVLEVSFDRLSQAARHVVSGDVVSIDPVRGENGYIYSDVTLAVRQAVPAQLIGRSYTFRMIGGELDGRRVSVQGMPRFETGQEVVLFLNARPSTVMGPTIGLWQGVFFVERDKQTGERFVVDSTRQPVLKVDGNRLIRGRTDSTTGVGLTVGGEAGGRLDVDRFFDQVRTYRAAR